MFGLYVLILTVLLSAAADWIAPYLNTVDPLKKALLALGYRLSAE